MAANEAKDYRIVINRREDAAVVNVACHVNVALFAIGECHTHAMAVERLDGFYSNHSFLLTLVNVLSTDCLRLQAVTLNSAGNRYLFLLRRQSPQRVAVQ